MSDAHHSPMRLLVAGCGYVGTALGLELAAEGHEVWGLRRDPSRLPEPIAPVTADLRDRDALAGALDAPFDAVVYAASPDGRDEEAYRDAYVRGPANVLSALDARGTPPGRFVYVSSTGVYAQRGGEWVDEQSPTEPTEFSGASLLEGERVVLGSGVPAVVVRFAGIYGPGRTSMLEKIRRGEARAPADGPRWTNRIHRDDCAGVLRHVLSLPEPDEVYVATDHEPVDLAEVQRWIAAELGVPPPPVAAEAPRADDAVASRRLRSNKRCRNARLVRSGYVFRYPTYREGYRALIAGDG